MYPHKTIGSDEIRIILSFLIFFKKNVKSFLKYKIIASNEPECKLISRSNPPFSILKNSVIIMRCADELIGKNSVMPCTIDKTIISNINYELYNLFPNTIKCIFDMQIKHKK